MLKTSKLMLALLLGTSAGPLGFCRQETPSGAASEMAPKSTRNAAGRNERPGTAIAADVTFRNLDPKTERRMLELANQSRAKFGAPPLTIDSGLSRAARLHAEAMLSAGRLSHQFGGEPSLPQRLAASSTLLLDQSGENVALDHNAAAAHQHLMLSPPHPQNLLNPAYNVGGLGVVRKGDRLYIVQDFGRALPNYSSPEAKDL